MLGSAESEMVSIEIIFQEFQPNVYDHVTSTLETDGLTDRRTDNLPLLMGACARGPAFSGVHCQV